MGQAIAFCGLPFHGRRAGDRKRPPAPQSSSAATKPNRLSHAKTPRRKDLKVFLCVLAPLRETSDSATAARSTERREVDQKRCGLIDDRVVWRDLKEGRVGLAATQIHKPFTGFVSGGKPHLSERPDP